ncbi:hypothetical protein [Actinomadura sp. 21ATH]|uniref:hypothetical protein n=1 Tax=Actinomadura sp. 21ATH TaxID=1735444 RepID=UPI0035BF3AC7
MLQVAAGQQVVGVGGEPVRGGGADRALVPVAAFGGGGRGGVQHRQMLEVGGQVRGVPGQGDRARPGGVGGDGGGGVLAGRVDLQPGADQVVDGGQVGAHRHRIAQRAVQRRVARPSVAQPEHLRPVPRPARPVAAGPGLLGAAGPAGLAGLVGGQGEAEVPRRRARLAGGGDGEPVGAAGLVGGDQPGRQQVAGQGPGVSGGRQRAAVGPGQHHHGAVVRARPVYDRRYLEDLENYTAMQVLWERHDIITLHQRALCSSWTGVPARPVAAGQVGRCWVMAGLVW